jgi:hypothetical protein
VALKANKDSDTEGEGDTVKDFVMGNPLMQSWITK